jgi:hypothetical protein
LQKARFDGDWPTFQRIRRQLANGGIIINFENDYPAKVQAGT